MKLKRSKTYKLTLLSPLYYRTKVESGAAGATTTSPWIGDIALLYAINNSLCLKHVDFSYTSHKPDYSELMDLGIVLSIAEPLKSVRFTKVYDIATNFLSEGFPQDKKINDFSRASMRNWLRRQGIEPGNEFIFSAFFLDDNRNLPESFTIRLGNTKECLAVAEEINNRTQVEISLNLYTISLLRGREKVLDRIKGILSSKTEIQIEQVLPQYVLAKGLSVGDVEQLILN